MESTKTRKIDIDYVIGFLIVIVFMLANIFDGVNIIRHQIIEFDAGYNATVAANLMRYGEYRVSYPSNINFYNIITTGQAVILPTAFMFKVFGINNITTTIVALIYGVLVIPAIWCMFGKCFSKRRGTYSVSAVLTVLLLLSDDLYMYISTSLLGESAALFFLVVACIFLIGYYENKEKYKLGLSGVFVAFAFLTKSSMIFFVVTFAGMIFIENLIINRERCREVLSFIGGFLLGFLVLDSYKFFRLGSIKEYLAWWIEEWANMLNQSSGIDTTYSLGYKVELLESFFVGCNRYFCLVMLGIPIAIYILRLVLKIFKGKEYIGENMVPMLFAGLGGVSLFVYFVLLGGKGLVYPRRLEVNQIFVRMFWTYLIGKLFFLLSDIIKEKRTDRKVNGKIVINILVMFVVSCLVFPWNQIKENVVALVVKEDEDNIELQQMNNFLNEVEHLEEDAIIYCAGWCQEPNITLQLDREIVDIYDSIENGKKVEGNSYFVSGQVGAGVRKWDLENLIGAELVRIDSGKLEGEEDFERFAIYKIVNKDNKINK